MKFFLKFIVWIFACIGVFAVMLLIASIVLGAPSATLAYSGAMLCGKYDKVIHGLRDRYGETVIARAQTSEGNMVLAMNNPTTTSWTLLFVLPYPPRLTCIMGHGHGWQWVIPESVAPSEEL